MGGVLAHISVRIISTSSTNTRHKHIASNTKRSEDNTNTNIQIHHENHWIDCIYHAASYGFSTFWSVSFPRWTTLYCTSCGDRASAFRLLIGWHWSKTRCCDDTWKKACTHSTCGSCDIGLGVQKIFNPTNGQVNSNDVRGLANTLQKYLPFPFLATGRQGSRGAGSSRKPTGGKPTGGKPTGGKPTGRTPTQGGGGEGEEGR